MGKLKVVDLFSGAGGMSLGFELSGKFTVTAAIDNLIKGAAGGSIQLMNKLWGLDDCRGLQSSSVPWT